MPSASLAVKSLIPYAADHGVTLVDNAIAHWEKGTRVEVRSGVSDGQVRVDVVDHGDGVDVADVEGLTRRFSRGDSGSGGRRVGLGLALVTQIVRSHGGRLEVTETPGRGDVHAADPGS